MVDPPRIDATLVQLTTGSCLRVQSFVATNSTIGKSSIASLLAKQFKKIVRTAISKSSLVTDNPILVIFSRSKVGRGPIRPVAWF